MLQDRTTVTELVDCIRSRWIDLADAKIALSYNLAGHSQCALDFDEDISTMLSYCHKHGIETVDVNIMTREVVLSDGEGISDDCNDDILVEDADFECLDEVLREESRITTKRLLSFGWSDGIAKVG